MKALPEGPPQGLGDLRIGRIGPAEDPREERLRLGVPSHLGDERGALSLADVVADRLARRGRVPERPLAAAYLEK